MTLASASFPALGVTPDLATALRAQGIVSPTDIQQLALPPLLAGGDATLIAATGTGKTLAYLLPIFCRLDAATAATQAVIVAPTHELALQIHRQCCDLAQNGNLAIRAILLIGGTSVARQLDKLKAKPQVAVGTLGRVHELIESGKLKVQTVRTLVVDEADRVMSDESLPTVRAIVQSMPRGCQLVFASATEQDASASAIAALAPRAVTLRPEAAAVNADISHFYLLCEDRDKSRVLRQLLHALTPERALVFAHSHETAGNVVEHLAHHGIRAAEIHGAADKWARKRAMDDFRSAHVRVLVASDVAARGLDIAGVTHVFNLDVPTQSKAYLHRVGRTARAGAKGEAITLAAGYEVKLVERYERELGITVHKVRLREGRVIPARED